MVAFGRLCMFILSSLQLLVSYLKFLFRDFLLISHVVVRQIGGLSQSEGRARLGLARDSRREGSPQRRSSLLIPSHLSPAPHKRLCCHVWSGFPYPAAVFQFSVQFKHSSDYFFCIVDPLFCLLNSFLHLIQSGIRLNYFLFYSL